MISVPLEQAVMIRPICSLRQESTKLKVQKLSLCNKPERHVDDQTHTHAQKKFSLEIQGSALGHT